MESHAAMSPAFATLGTPGLCPRPRNVYSGVGLAPRTSGRPLGQHYRAARRRPRATPGAAVTCTAVLRTGVLVSGGGRSLQNICERIEHGSLTGVTVSVVVASKSTAGALARAERFGIQTRVLEAKDYAKDTNDYSDAISNVLDEFKIDLVVLAGWIHFFMIPKRYMHKVINIHPSLIPSFCGKGYYGDRVHEAVLRFGAKITGCTVHVADNEYDHGPIIIQRAVKVLEDDDVSALAARVFEAEKEALPDAIQLFADGRLTIADSGRLQISEPKATASHTASEAK